MSKKISLIKKFNKLLLSVNARIESFFNNIKLLANSKKKIKDIFSNIDKRILIGIGSILLLILGYFLTPSFYNKDLVKDELADQIIEKYNLEVKFDGTLEYGFLPKPHFLIKDTIIIYNEEIIAKTDITKIYITANNFFSLDEIKIKDLLFKNSEFNINKNNYDIFEKILNSNKSDYLIDFKNNKLFYKDQNEDVIFLANIKNLKFLYNDEFNQELNTNLEIFNMPLKMKIVNNISKKIYFINLESHKLRINIENSFDYSKEKIKGLFNFKIINNLKKINYEINKNSLNFESEDNDFKGKIDFKPFYLISDLNLYQLDLYNLFKSDSLFLDLLNAEILNNQSLNAVVNVNFDKIKNINYLKDIVFKTYFEEGNIIIKDSSLNWKNSVFINLNEVQLVRENNKIIFIGTINLDFKNIADFYRQYQIKKINRKKISNIKLDFLLNVTENQFQFDNLKVDGVSNKIIDNFLNDLNSKKPNLFNKVIFKNSIKEFFSKI